MKYFSEEVGVRLMNLLSDILGPLSMIRDCQRYPFADDLYHFYLGAIAYTIAGGSAEIQKDTIARFGLS